MSLWEWQAARGHNFTHEFFWFAQMDAFLQTCTVPLKHTSKHVYPVSFYCYINVWYSYSKRVPDHWRKGTELCCYYKHIQHSGLVINVICIVTSKKDRVVEVFRVKRDRPLCCHPRFGRPAFWPLLCSTKKDKQQAGVGMLLMPLQSAFLFSTAFILFADELQSL